MDKQSLIDLAKQTAVKYGLDPNIVCAVIEQESGWNTSAIRYEPSFMTKYVAPLYTSGKLSATEAYARSFSWGLMQIMGQVAREEGFEGPFLAELCDPATGIDLGCIHLKNDFDRMNWDSAAALQRWNGGGNPNYAAEVLARVDNYAVSNQ